MIFSIYQFMTSSMCNRKTEATPDNKFEPGGVVFLLRVKRIIRISKIIASSKDKLLP